mmetsp:Transcript_64549/g.151706  ORF Transcript_64549/g.151706 Transcript_64549/m.151706 type:complete len:447 (-) Transcript_64549:150-1490(-)
MTGELHIDEEPTEPLDFSPENSQELPKSPKSPEAGSTLGDQKRALLRKVAQLTKVVEHLNSKNGEQELEYARLRDKSEEQIQHLYESASRSMQNEASKLQEIASRACLQENSARLESLFGQQRAELAAEVRNLRETSRGKQASVVQKTGCEIQRLTQQVHDISQRMRQSLDSYRATLKRRAAEMEQRNVELRQDRAAELKIVEHDFQQRLDELKGSLQREADHVKQSTEQALLHMKRMHEAETSSWQMQVLQKRHERIQRLEQEFGEERRMREQSANNLDYELVQQRKDLLDFKASYRLVDQQVDAMRGTLEEMRMRVRSSQADADTAREEASKSEAETQALGKEIALLEVRRRAAGIPAGVVAPPRKAPRAPANGLAEELRDSIANAKQLEAEMAQTDSQLGDLEDELAEKDKTVEILEVETEEERLRTHRLQARILQLETALKT